jgi:hypothetical protein
MESFWQDLRFAFRALGKSPWFAALAVVTLALGIAVNTSIFSTINGFLLRPMPVPHPEQLAVLSLQQVGERTFQKFSYPDYVINPLPLATSSPTELRFPASPLITEATTASSRASPATIFRCSASSLRSAA